MRTLVVIALLANVFLLVYGQGFFGVAPSELGRSPSPKPLFNYAHIEVGLPHYTN